MPSDGAYLRFGPYTLHRTQGLLQGAHEIRVTPKSLALLYALAERAREVVTKAELFNIVWPDSIVTDAALSSCIRELRRALGDDARAPSYIETVHRRGFRLVPAVTRISGAGPALQSLAAVPAPPPDEDAPAADRSFAKARPSIVVLPFDNVSGDAPAGIVARGLVHDIITRVARSRTAFIIARGTTFHYADGGHDIARVASELGVRYVVQGAVQVRGSRLKVTVALADAPTREEVWSQEYHRDLADFMLVQEEIATLIASSIESEIQREAIQQSLLMPSSSLDAWSAYHRGIHQMYRFKADACEEAERLFRRSIALEPGVPRPHAGLSFVHFERVFLGYERDRAAGIQQAIDHALESLSIDPLDPMGHWALSRAHLLRGDLEAAKSSLETAIELNPSYAIAQYSLGWVGLQSGDNELCLDRVGFARRLSPYDPLKFAMQGVYALNLALMGRTAEAAELSASSTLQPNAHHQALAFAAVAHALDGRTDTARRLFARVRQASSEYDVQQFLGIFAFRRERDVEAIRRAFKAMRGGRA